MSFSLAFLSFAPLGRNPDSNQDQDVGGCADPGNMYSGPAVTRVSKGEGKDNT